MKKKRSAIKTKSGYTLVELVLVMAILGILGGTLVAVTGVGSKAFSRINGEFSAQSEARAAMSFITVKLRQNDMSGIISIDTAHMNALKIDPPMDAGVDNCWYIYFDPSDKKLKEISGTTFNTAAALVIAEGLESAGFEITDDPASLGRSVKTSITYKADASTAVIKSLTETVALRSDS